MHESPDFFCVYGLPIDGKGTMRDYQFGPVEKAGDVMKNPSYGSGKTKGETKYGKPAYIYFHL